MCSSSGRWPASESQGKALGNRQLGDLPYCLLPWVRTLWHQSFLLPSPPRSGGEGAPKGRMRGLLDAVVATSSVVNRALHDCCKRPLTRCFAPPSPTLARGEGRHRGGGSRKCVCSLSPDPTAYCLSHHRQ